jgi:hypothetical protein
MSDCKILEFKNKIDITDELRKESKTGKIVLGYFNEEGDFASFWENLTLMEKLFVVDSFKRRIDIENPS